MEKKLDTLKVEKQYLYEQFKLKQLDKDAYLNKVEALREEERMICEEIRRAKEEKDRDKEQRESKVCHKEIGSLTKEIVEQMIDVVYVNGKGEFKIVWKEKGKNEENFILLDGVITR